MHTPDQRFYAGEFRHFIDEKNRITIPARWRRGDAEEFIILPEAKSEFLLVMSPEEFSRMSAAAESDPNVSARDRRVFFRQRHRFVIRLIMNALLFERPVWFATGPLVLEEEPQEMEDFTYHRPVLAAEAIELLAPHPGSLVVDGTVGGGGHTESILKTGADVLALDQDPDAIEQAREELAHFGSRVTLRQTNFRNAEKILDELGVQKIGGALLDLGVSSRQLENPTRGFSIMRNGPLDMRMDPRSTITAADIVNRCTEEALTRLFRDLGEEPAARRIASLIVKMRKDSPFTETLQLARAIEKVV